MGGEGRKGDGREGKGRGGEGKERTEEKGGERGLEGRGAPPLLILQFNHCLP